MISDPNTSIWIGTLGKGNAAQLRIHDDLISLRTISPATQISDDDSLRRDRFVTSLAPDTKTLPFSVVISSALFECAAANRRRDVHFIGSVRRVRFFNWFGKQLCIVAEHAECVLLARPVETESRRARY